MASSDGSCSVVAATVHGSDVVSVIAQQQDTESARASEAADPVFLSNDPTEDRSAVVAPAAALQAPQDLIPVVVATSGVSIGVKDEHDFSSPGDCRFQDAGVQTDFDGEKLPDGFVPYTKHSGESGLYMRDVILGLNDGLVSMFLLLLGVSGGGVKATEVLLAGITGALAGAISMALSEYIATKSQKEVTLGDLKLEKEHFKYHREVELAQVREVFEELGLKGDVLEETCTAVGSSDDTLLEFMKAFEFGCSDEDMERSSFKASLVSGGLFLLGSLPAVVPFACTNVRNDAIIAASVCCCAMLFFVGAAKTKMTRANLWVGGFENMFYGAAGAAVSYGIGALYDYAAPALK